MVAEACLYEHSILYIRKAVGIWLKSGVLTVPRLEVTRGGVETCISQQPSSPRPMSKNNLKSNPDDAKCCES